MFIIVSTSSYDGSLHHYGVWRSSEAARMWGLNFHGTSKGWEIVEINRVN